MPIAINRSIGLAVVTLVAISGVIVFARSRAAGQFLAAEPESGTISGSAKIVADMTASHAQAVQFASSTSSGTSFTPAGMRSLPDPLYGLTLDDVSGASTARISTE